MSSKQDKMDEDFSPLVDTKLPEYRALALDVHFVISHWIVFALFPTQPRTAFLGPLPSHRLIVDFLVGPRFISL
jgi:hypothetical protein